MEPKVLEIEFGGVEIASHSLEIESGGVGMWSDAPGSCLMECGLFQKVWESGLAEWEWS